MRFAFYIKLAGSLAASITVGVLASAQSITSLESAMPGAVGAIVGGVVAALAFAFVVLGQIYKTTSTEVKDLNQRYQAVTQSLLSDVKILIWCLAASILLPVVRHIDIPGVTVPPKIASHFSKSQLVTSLEVFTVVVSISVLFEVCHCMFQVFIADSLIGNKPPESPSDK